MPAAVNSRHALASDTKSAGLTPYNNVEIPFGKNTLTACESGMMDSPDEKDNHGARLLPYITGLVNQELLLPNEYLAAENRILRSHLPSRLRLSDPERSTLAEIGNRLGRKALAQVACVAKPDTILA